MTDTNADLILNFTPRTPAEKRLHDAAMAVLDAQPAASSPAQPSEPTPEQVTAFIQGFEGACFYQLSLEPYRAAVAEGLRRTKP